MSGCFSVLIGLVLVAHSYRCNAMILSLVQNVIRIVNNFV